ncbi:MAG: hypothetical protein ACPGSD_12680 [Flavobacteriales bacterium]
MRTFNYPKLGVLILCILFLRIGISFSQVGIGTTTPHKSSILDVNSTTKGFLPPRFTKADRDNNIQAPAEGLMVFCTDCCDYGSISFFNGTEWKEIVTPCSDNSGGGGGTPPVIPELPKIKEIIAAGHAVKFHDIYLTVPTEQGEIYSIGRNNAGQLGTGSTTDLDKQFQKVDFSTILDPNEKVLQAHCLGAGSQTSIILTSFGKVYTTGTMFNTNNVFVELDINNETAIGLASSEEGFVVVTASQKVYAYGNISNKNQGTTPFISNLPVPFNSIIAIDGGGSNIILFTENQFYTLGQNNYAKTYPASNDLVWNEGKTFISSSPWSFNSINKVDVGKNNILAQDSDGIILFNNNSFNNGTSKPLMNYSPNTITHNDIVDFSVSNNGLFFATDNQLLTGNNLNASVFIPQTNALLPDYYIVQFTGSSSLEFLYIKGKHKTTGIHQLFSYKSGTLNNVLGDFPGNNTVKVAFPDASYNGAENLLF